MLVKARHLVKKILCEIVIKSSFTELKNIKIDKTLPIVVRSIIYVALGHSTLPIKLMKTNASIKKVYYIWLEFEWWCI